MPLVDGGLARWFIDLAFERLVQLVGGFAEAPSDPCGAANNLLADGARRGGSAAYQLACLQAQSRKGRIAGR